MAIRIDPENNETPALFDLVNFSGQSVLEIGCGNGRVTWRYADKAAHVTGIDPDAKQIALAREQLPSQLQDRIEFHNIAFEDFASTSEASVFDIVILARSLCWMEYGGMVHALEEIHRLLKPNGALIDIHPVSEPSSIEIHQAEKIDLVGLLSVRQWCFEFEQADIALAEITQRGMFIMERNALFDLPTHYASAAELGTELKESVEIFARDAQAAIEPIPHIEELTERAEELMRAAGSDAELIVHERTHISRLRPA